MRPAMRYLLVTVLCVAIALLALGALPSYLGAGDPYHLTVESVETAEPAVDVPSVAIRT